MRDLPESTEAAAAWLNQSEDASPVELEALQERRTRELFSSTRSEIVGSIAAALFFSAVMAWRFAAERDRVVQFGCVAVVVWVAVTGYRSRSSIRRDTPEPDLLARTGLEHYRAELLRRRDHLRSEWLWHGPLLLACAVAGATLAKRIVPGRLWGALPLILALAGWAVVGIRRRRRNAAELQREIDAISPSSSIEE